MPEAIVTLEHRHGTAWLTISNPLRKNALTVAMMIRLRDLLVTLDTDATVHTVVLQGAGGTFCSGMDIGSLDTPDIGPRPQDLAAQLEETILTLGHPTVALVEGHAIGAGCQIASACDLRFLVEGSLMGLPPARMGLVYPPTSLRRLREIIGDTALRRLVFTADPVDHREAGQMGWAETVTDCAEAEQRIQAFAQKLQDRSGLTIRATKDLLHCLATGVDPGPRFQAWEAERIRTGETTEGVRAFAEKRTPVFPSRTEAPPT